MRGRSIPAHLRTGSEEQSVTLHTFRQAGAIVYCTSDIASRRVTPGISDKLIIFPGARILLGWDDKAGEEQYGPTDERRLSKEQAEFGKYLGLGLRTTFAFGDNAAALRWLQQR